MEDKYKKNLLPAPSQKMTLSNLRELSEALIPEHYKGTTELAKLKEAYQSFENAEDAKITYSELHREYRLADADYKEKTKEKPMQEQNEQIKINRDVPVVKEEQKQALQVLLERNSLEEYRIKKGLDKLREKLKERIVDAASFEKGLEKLIELVTENSIPPAVLGLDKEYTKGLNLCPEAEAINGIYPDMTADEITWLSLAKIKPKSFIFNYPAPLYYPPALIDIDLNGIRFAHGTIDERAEDSIKASNRYQIAGITGVSPQYQLVPLDENVSQVVKALVLLGINDTDLFNKIWEEQDDTATRRGDLILLKTFIKNRAGKYKVSANFERQSLEDMVSSQNITSDDIKNLRSDIAGYYHKIKLQNDAFENGILDFVKLSGLLSRLPKFVTEEKPFEGHVRMYGSNVDFISNEGEIADSVPLAEHLLYNTSYQFHTHVNDISKKNEVMRKLFDELRTKISDENLGKNKLAVDALQGRIFEKYGIFVPTSVHTLESKLSPFDMNLSLSREKTLVEHTVKFSYKEMRMIEEILKKLPAGAAGYVRSIFKEISDAATIHAFRTGIVKSGHYDEKNKRITISLPFEVPNACSDTQILSRIAMASPGKRKVIEKEFQNQYIHYGYFKHTLLHEIAESLWANISEDSRKEWLKLWSASEINNPQSSFLTPYAKKSENEDFSESFAVYMMYGEDFRRRAEKWPVIKAKYNFMKKLWSADGKQRKFGNQLRIKMSSLLGKPEDDMEEMSIKDHLMDLAQQDFDMTNLERVRFATEVLSYEQLKDSVVEEEENGSPRAMDSAARKHMQESQKISDETEDMRLKGGITRLVMAKTEEALYNLKVGRDLSIFSLQTMLYHGQREEAINWLLKTGAKKKKAEKAVDDLLRMYRYFDEFLDHFDNKDLMKEVDESVGEYLREFGNWRKKQEESKDTEDKD